MLALVAEGQPPKMKMITIQKYQREKITFVKTKAGMWKSVFSVNTLMWWSRSASTHRNMECMRKTLNSEKYLNTDTNINMKLN